jgi:uncharacterized phage-associated protein
MANDKPKTLEELREENEILKERLNLRKGLTNSQWEYIQNTRESMEMQKSILGDAKQYLVYVKKTKELEKDIAFLQKQKALAVGKNAAETQKLQKELDREIEKLKAQKKLYEANLQAVSKTKMLLNETVKGLQKLPGAITSAYGKLKGYGLFEMDKAVKNSALSMGLLKKRSDSFYKSIGAASNQITAMGGTIEEATKMQAAYSEEIGRSVLLGGKNLANITAISKGTGMGADGAAKMAAEFEQQGMSVEKVAKFMEQTMNDASKMGLNSSKVIKNISSNMKMLNRYNFKGGVQGFKKMAETVTKLGINMNSVAGMADKLMNIDGAVEMSAKLQVLGGKWSQLADPFKLMYMARNDMEGLTKAVAEAASENARFDKDGNIQLAAVEMSRLREVSEATGVELETLVTAGKNMAKFKKIRTQMSVTGLSDEEKDFLENTAQFDKNGKAYIEIEGQPKLLSQLGSSAKDVIKQQMAEKATLAERAKAAMTFDDQIKSLIEQIKVFFLPFVKTLAEKAAPAFEKVRAWFEREKIGERLEKLGKWLAETIGGFLEFAAEHPYVSIAALIAGKAAMWIANGALMASGFRMGMTGFNLLGGAGSAATGGAGSAAAGGAGSAAAGGAGAAEGGAAGGAAAGGGAGAAALTAAAVVSVAKTAKDQVDFFSSKSARSTGVSGWLEALGGTGAGILEIIPKALGLDTQGFGFGIKGMGTDDVALGRAVYRQLHPNAPTSIPNKDLIADIKANPDKYPDDVVSGAATAKLDDGVMFNPRDKFMKLNDGTMIAGTNVNGNNNLAKSIMAMNANAPGSGSLNSNAPATIKVDEIKLSGMIDVRVNGESTKESRELGQNLMHDPSFVRELSLRINKATAESLNGKPK